MDWKTAFLVQAKAEYEVLLLLLDCRNLARSHTLHYVQMVSEKLAKGMTYGKEKPPTTHEALVSFIRTADRVAGLREAFRVGSQRQFRQYLQALLPIANDVQNLAPQGMVEAPNPEYPWKDLSAQVVAPTTYAFLGRMEAKDQQMARLMDFLKSCFEYIAKAEGV